MSENTINDDLVYREPAKIIERKNLFCIISLETSGEYAIHEILTNSTWEKNPNPERYAVVPDDLVPAIMETCGFCDIELNEDGTEVISFVAREIPHIPDPDPEPSENNLLWQTITDMEIEQMEYLQTLTDLEIEVMSE